MRHEFEVTEGDGKNVKLSVRKPDLDSFEEADKVYAIKISSLIRENVGKKKLLSRQDLSKFLKESGAWTDEDEQAVKKLQKDIDIILSEMKKGGKKASEGRDLAIKSMDRRKDMVKIMAKRQVFDDVTLESFAENEKIDYLIYSATVYADSGKNYWDSFEDMKNDKLSQAYKGASSLAMQVIFDLDVDFEKNLPENKWLKKYNFIDDDLNYIDRKTGEKVDRSGKPIAELEASLKKEIDNLKGDIIEQSPFIDDETNEPIVV